MRRRDVGGGGGVNEKGTREEDGQGSVEGM
jgi:hypothetical protein